MRRIALIFSSFKEFPFILGLGCPRSSKGRKLARGFVLAHVGQLVPRKCGILMADVDAFYCIQVPPGTRSS